MANPVPNSNLYFKFYSDKDNDNYKNQSGNMEAIFSEAHMEFYQEKKGYGFKSNLFFRENGQYWTDSSLLGIINTGSVNNDGNGQGVRFDLWHPHNGSMTYVFSDFSQGSGDDIHLMRLRQEFFQSKFKTGLFLQQKNYATGLEEDYNRVIAQDFKLNIDKYYLNAEYAFSFVPSEDETSDLTEEYQKKAEDFYKSNIATKIELHGLEIGKSNLGHWFFKPGFYTYGNTYRNYMGDNKSNEIGYWINSYYLIPGRAITLTLNYSKSNKIVPDTIFVDGNDKEIYNPTTNIYSEIYVEFVKGFKGKLYFNKRDEKWQGNKYRHYDFFSELSVENRLAKLLTQFKIKDINEDNEKQIAGIELGVNLSDKWRVFTRGMIANDKVSARHSFFGEVQYRISGNTELFLQYGPSWYGAYGLVNDDGFVASGEMSKEFRLMLKGWF